MKKVKITAIRKTCYPDLMAKYENPIEHACDVEEGQVWIANGWAKPEGFCNSAWDSISSFVMTLAHGGGNFYDGWMKMPIEHDRLFDTGLITFDKLGTLYLVQKMRNDCIGSKELGIT